MDPILQSFLDEVTKSYSKDAKILSKNTSRLMKVISWFLKPFNPRFMDESVTTIGNTIYTPDAFLAEGNPIFLLEVISHESIHVFDFNKHKLTFFLSYLFPQVLALLGFLGVLLSLVLLNPWFLLFLVSFIFLAPFPAWWRYTWELRGYRTTILFARKVWNYSDQAMLGIYSWISETLSKEFYYFSWPFPGMIVKALQDESWMQDKEYQDITKFLERHNLLLLTP